MPVRKGTLGYESKLTRRMAQRSIKQMNKIIKSSKYTRDEHDAARGIRDKMEDLVSQTYFRSRKPNAKERGVIEQANAQIRALTSSAKISRGSNGAANLYTQWQINEASKKRDADEPNPSIYTQEQVKIFYKLTQRVWMNNDGTPTDTKMINRRIMEYFRTDSLAIAMERALSTKEAKQALAVAAVQNQEKLTKEQRRLYEEALAEDTEDQVEISPPYLTGLIGFDPDVKWNEQLE